MVCVMCICVMHLVELANVDWCTCDEPAGLMDLLQMTIWNPRIVHAKSDIFVTIH